MQNKAKQIKAHLTLLHAPHVTKQENWQKKLWQIESDSPNLPNFLPPKFFTVWYIGKLIMNGCLLWQ